MKMKFIRKNGRIIPVGIRKAAKVVGTALVGGAVGAMGADLYHKSKSKAKKLKKKL